MCCVQQLHEANEKPFVRLYLSVSWKAELKPLTALGSAFAASPQTLSCWVLAWRVFQHIAISAKVETDRNDVSKYHVTRSLLFLTNIYIYIYMFLKKLKK